MILKRVLEKLDIVRADFFEAYNNLGSTLQESGKLEESEASYEHAIALKPDYAEAHSNLGNMLKRSRQIRRGGSQLQPSHRIEA